jgi:hypothetical protein
MKSGEVGFNELFNQFRDSIMRVDPVYFCSKYLNVDGKPLQLEGTGYKPFADIYRYIALKAIDADSKPIVLVKGRQVGATTMAAALECYFGACGLFGTNDRPPMRMMHLFPTLSLAAAYTKDKLDPIIGNAISVPGMMKSNGILKSYMEARLDLSSPTNNNMHFKKFISGNQVWIESTGLDGDRVRGRSVDACFYDECFPYDQYIETSIGKIKIGNLYELWSNNYDLPLIKTYNEKSEIFEYKKLIKAWKRGERDIVLVRFENGEIKCTDNHLFLTTQGWIEAGLLTAGDLVRTENSELVVVKNIENLFGKEIVYDVEIEDNHNFIASLKNDCGIIVHNCQDMSDVAIGASTKVLAQSRYGAPGDGVQVYYGTPKTKGGSYWNMWRKSSQNYFHLRCEKCGKYFPLYHPSINWEEVWIYGLTVRCTECHHEQDKLEAQERGKWIPLNNPDECDFVGYHINQLYIPHFTKETIEKAKPERSPINTERVYMNEVLGEFFDGEGGTITAQEIRDKCIDKGRKMVKYIFAESGKRTYAGFDWGQRGALEQIAGKGRKGSYSCAVILTVSSGNIFNVEFATRLLRPDPETKMGTVEEMFRRYNMTLSVGDIGDAYDLTHKLQRVYDEKFLASRSSHRVNGHIKYSNDEWPKTIVFEKDYYISELLGLLKEGRIKFPGGSYDRIEWMIDHCSSMDIKVTRDKSGEPLKKYVRVLGQTTVLWRY